MENKETLIRFGLDIQFFAEENEEDPNNQNHQPDPNQVKEDEVEEEDENGGKKDSKPTKQSQSDNAKYAQQRREAEAKAKADKEAREKELQRAKEEGIRQGKIEALRTNPYTEQPIEDDYDLEVYEIQKELDKQGKDPTKDLPRELARRRREKAKADKEKSEAEKKSKQEAELKKKEQLSRMKQEIQEAEKKYGLSDEEMSALLDENTDFGKKVKEKQGRWTLEEIFEAYYKPKSDKKERSTPSATQGGSKVEKSVKDMNEDEFIAHMTEKYGGF